MHFSGGTLEFQKAKSHAVLLDYQVGTFIGRRQRPIKLSTGIMQSDCCTCHADAEKILHREQSATVFCLLLPQTCASINTY